jgi:hypothetical protein
MEFAIPDRQYDIAGRHMQALFTRLLLDRGFKVSCECASAQLLSAVYHVECDARPPACRWTTLQLKMR